MRCYNFYIPSILKIKQLFSCNNVTNLVLSTKLVAMNIRRDKNQREFDKIMESSLHEADKVKMLESLGHFVVKFEDYTDLIRMAVSNSLEKQGLKNGRVRYVFIEGKQYSQLIDLLQRLIMESFVILDDEDNISNDVRKDSTYCLLNPLIESSRHLGEIRNYLIHGTWSEMLPIRLLFDDESFPFISGSPFLVSKNKGNQMSRESIRPSAILSDLFFQKLHRYLDELINWATKLNDYLRTADLTHLKDFGKVDNLKASLQKLKTDHLSR